LLKIALLYRGYLLRNKCLSQSRYCRFDRKSCDQACDMSRNWSLLIIGEA